MESLEQSFALTENNEDLAFSLTNRPLRDRCLIIAVTFCPPFAGCPFTFHGINKQLGVFSFRLVAQLGFMRPVSPPNLMLDFRPTLNGLPAFVTLQPSRTNRLLIHPICTFLTEPFPDRSDSCG